ncbi:MAG: hypothetical protein ACXW3R_03855 [Rhodoplanes sp.]
MIFVRQALLESAAPACPIDGVEKAEPDVASRPRLRRPLVHTLIRKQQRREPGARRRQVRANFLVRGVGIGEPAHQLVEGDRLVPVAPRSRGAPLARRLYRRASA